LIILQKSQGAASAGSFQQDALYLLPQYLKSSNHYKIIDLCDHDKFPFICERILQSKGLSRELPQKKPQGEDYQVVAVTTYINPITALIEFKPYYYDLLLVDINMPSVDGYEFVEKIVKLDLNIKVCFMSSGEE
jgi:CheY-like chemotaxis protein